MYSINENRTKRERTTETTSFGGITPPGIQFPDIPGLSVVP